MPIIDKIISYKRKRNRDYILIKNYKKSKYDTLQLHRIIKNQNMIPDSCIKKTSPFEEKLSEMIGEPKEFWESLKSLGISNKAVISNFNAVEENVTLTYGTCLIFKIFKNFFSNLMDSLLIKLPNHPDKFNLQAVITFYSSFTISNAFSFNSTSEEKIFKIMTNVESSKAAGVDKLSGRFLQVNGEQRISTN